MGKQLKTFQPGNLTCYTAYDLVRSLGATQAKEKGFEI
jgi:hypothetical protein